MNDENEDENTYEEDFYAFLNVSKKATCEEITNAYRRLSRLYHPDKHQDTENKEEAQHLFNKAKKAYEVLCDPQRRAIYDTLGMKGLETDGWEIIQRQKTPQEIHDEYEQLAKEREQRRLFQRTNPKGTITVTINARDLFYKDPYDNYRLIPYMEITGITIHQSIEAPLTLKETATLSAVVHSHNGIGSGNIACTLWKVLSSKAVGEGELVFGSNPSSVLKISYNIAKRSYVTLSGMVLFIPDGLQFGMNCSLITQLDKYTTGNLTWKEGYQSGISTSLVHEKDTNYMSSSLHIGLPHSYVAFSYAHKFIDSDIKARIAIKFGTFGTLFEYGLEKKITKYSTLGASVSIGSPSGIILKLKISERQKEALAAIELMKETVARIKREENEKGGLIIVKAVYGQLVQHPISFGEAAKIIDVTIPLQCLVKDSSLIVHDFSKSHLPGFYDPCIGEDKFLRVEYKFHGLLHKVIVSDQEVLKIPKQSHLIQTHIEDS